MRVLHTADWHIGRVLHNQPRRIDHERVLAEIVAIARDRRPDLILHAGDLFDALRPSYEDITLGLDTLRELAEVAPTVVLCGNHDSPVLFRIFQKLLGPASRLRFVDRARLPDAGGILDFPVGDRRLRLAPLPFVHQNRLLEAFEDPAKRTVTYADRLGDIESVLRDGLLDGYDPTRDVLLFAAHLHVSGATYSGSERPLHVSDVYATRVEHLPVVSYAAFGHIHRPQQLTGTTPGRYSGSPLQLDFGEVGEKKEVVLVELEPGDPARIELVPLASGRRLRRFVGTMPELEALAPSVGEEICLITLNVEAPIVDLSDRVARLLPEAVVLPIQENVANRRLTTTVEGPSDTGAEPSLTEFFREYLEKQGTKGASADEVLQRFEQTLEALLIEQEPSFPEEAQLLADFPEFAEPSSSPPPPAPAPAVQTVLQGFESSDGGATPRRRR
ncbi:MAG TPA: exonuclease SbcCD subunit D [Thermoanaerobaculia bacterium]|jgi:exonuclease SbcD|nr:exonuclease SbcCD subunit D [Thermoanaerobaculia bacterium]